MKKNASGMSILYNLKSVPKTITVTKTWIGGPDVKPAATINIQMRQSSIYKEDFPVVFDNPSFVGLVNGLETWRETKSVVVETNRFSSFSATAKEVPVPKYRTAKIGGNWVTGFTVTNIFQNNVTATKTWVGGPDPKPTVVLRLNRQAGTGPIIKGYQRTLQPGNEVALWEGVGTEVANDAGVPYKYWVEELTVLNDYEKLEEGLSVTNTYVSPKTTIVEGKKDWVDGEKVRPESVTLILMRNGVEHTTQEGITSRVPVGKDEDWTHTWSGLVDNDSTGTPYEYSVDEVDVEDFVKTFRGNTVVNTYSSPTNTEVEAKKIWFDGEHLRPRTITLILKRNGIESDRVKVGAKQKWTHKWSGLEDNDSTGTPYTYSVDEIEVRNFEKSITGNVITNTYHSPKKMIVAAKKIWVDGENLRPEKVTLILKRNGIKIKEIEVGADEHWSHIWSGLENTNSKGLPYIYTVDEVAVPGFKKIVVGPIVTNFYVIPRTGSYGAEKIWQGDEGITKPVMIFDLYRKTDFIDEKVPAALSIEVDKDNTKATWEKLETTDSKGNPYSFYVKESFKEEDVTNDNWVLGEDVDGQITNRLITGEEKKAQLTVGKELLEQFYNPGLLGGNTDRIKFNFILTGPYGYEEEFELYAGEEKVFSELYYGAYKLVEINSQGYEALLSQEEVVLTKEAPVNKISVENKHKIDEMNGMDLNVTEMQVTKLWVNGPQSDHKAVEMVLYRTTGGQEQEVMADVTIENVKDGFHYLWENLDKHSPEGYSYIYFVKEKGEIEGEFKVDDRVYETVYDESTIRNTFLIQKIEVKAEKLWVNGPSVYPTVWFKLYRNITGGAVEAVPTDQAVIKMLGNGILTVKWEHLDATDINGNPYTFSVKEVDSEGNDFTPVNYEKVEEGLTVTNTYVSPKTEVTGTKVWKGGPSEHPTIELQLYRDGEAYLDAVTLDGSTNYT
ncbi:MAG: Cna B-type domain-containing protein, partial [Tissierellia bacterium]|nr:Cna B-type domain-containing protein [Tissierellia bacterium]